MAAIVNEETCIGCGACANICPVEAIKIENGKATVGDDCIECGACIAECPVEAIEI